MIIRFFSFLFVVCLALALVQCGRMGTPTGGPKDVTPPVLLYATPPNKTVNFTGK